jgi:PAS domain S-box-containing protein
MSWTVERRLALAFLLALALLIVNTVISFRASRSLIRNEKAVAHTLQVLNELEAIQSRLSDSETGQLGYVITGDKSYLEPYQSAHDEINQHLNNLRQLTADNASQQVRLPVLELKISGKLDELSSTIALRTQSGFEAAQQRLQSGQGKKEMDELRRIIAEMEASENDLLTRRAAESEASVHTRNVTFILASLTALASFALLFYLAIRGLNERKQSEENIRNQREWLHVTLSSIGDAVIATDTQGYVTFMNSVSESLTGWRQAEATAKPLGEVFKIINAHTRQPADNPVARVLREGKVVGLANHTRLIARDGTEIPIDDSAAPIRNNGELVGVVLVFRDVAERIRAEHEREQSLEREHTARTQAEAASHAKDEFLATVSHELRTPLTAILGWARLLSIGNLSGENSSKAIETIERNAKAQAQLIEDLLDMSRITSGKLRLSFEPVNLANVIETALESVGPTAQAKSIQLTANLDSAAGMVIGDASRLQQVIWNLLSNAVKFTPKGGAVEIRLARDNSQAEIIISDTGKGISAEFLPRLFQRFQQADTKDTRQQGGLGLGLAIVRQLVEMHAGTVTADSQGEDQGATFILKLPLMAVQADTSTLLEEHVNESRRLLDRLPRLDGVKVLVVDDEDSAREVIAAVLTQCGAVPTSVASVSDALTELKRMQPDVIVSDIGMPGENGYDLISKIRMLRADQGGDIPAVALTAYAKTEDRMRALAAGYQSHVPKPVEPAELALVIASLIERASGQRD